MWTYECDMSHVWCHIHDCRYPVLEIWVLNLFFGSVCTKNSTVTKHPWNGTKEYITNPLNGTYRSIIWKTYTSDTVTDAYDWHQPWEIFFKSVFDRNQILFYFCVSTPAPHVSYNKVCVCLPMWWFNSTWCTPWHTLSLSHTHTQHTDTNARTPRIRTTESHIMESAYTLRPIW